MSQALTLEQSYRRWLRCYPKSFRQEHEAEILGVLMDSTDSSRRQPERIECLHLVSSALWMRLRPTAPRSDRSVRKAIKLMYLGAAIECAVLITILATIGDIKSQIISRNPGYTAAQWHAELTGKLDPLIVASGIAVVFWLCMAWANGRGHRWARIAFAAFVAMNGYSLLSGVAHGSALYARADLSIGLVLWAIELAALVLIFSGSKTKSATA